MKSGTLLAFHDTVVILVILQFLEESGPQEHSAHYRQGMSCGFSVFKIYINLEKKEVKQW